MKALSLFAGAGGFDLGARWAGLDVIASIEQNPLAVQTLEVNGFYAIKADVTSMDFRQWQGVDVLFGGPPCQGHSVANNRNWQGNDPRNELMWEMVRAAHETSAYIVLIENVSSMDKQLLNDVARALGHLGYWVGIENLLASDYGVAQNRRRKFIYASKDICRHWPNPAQKMTIDQALKGLNFRESPLPDWLKRRGVNPGWRIIDAQNTNSLTTQGRFGYQQAQTMTSGSFYFRVKISDGTYGMLDPHGMARLQSFPDDHKFIGSRTQQALQVGNAVPPLMAQAIFEALCT